MKALIQTGSSLSACGHAQAGGRVSVPLKSDFLSIVWGWISPFAVCWLIAMLFLFTCFGRVGTVNGNIIQSSRGIIAILLGALLAKLGFTELEEKVDWQVFVRRLIAGALMIGAIAAFNYR